MRPFTREARLAADCGNGARPLCAVLRQERIRRSSLLTRTAKLLPLLAISQLQAYELALRIAVGDSPCGECFARAVGVGIRDHGRNQIVSRHERQANTTAITQLR